MTISAPHIREVEVRSLLADGTEIEGEHVRATMAFVEPALVRDTPLRNGKPQRPLAGALTAPRAGSMRDADRGVSLPRRSTLRNTESNQSRKERKRSTASPMHWLRKHLASQSTSAPGSINPRSERCDSEEKAGFDVHRVAVVICAASTGSSNGTLYSPN